MRLLFARAAEESGGQEAPRGCFCYCTCPGLPESSRPHSHPQLPCLPVGAGLLSILFLSRQVGCGNGEAEEGTTFSCWGGRAVLAGREGLLSSLANTVAPGLLLWRGHWDLSVVTFWTRENKTAGVRSVGESKEGAVCVRLPVGAHTPPLRCGSPCASVPHLAGPRGEPRRPGNGVTTWTRRSLTGTVCAPSALPAAVLLLRPVFEASHARGLENSGYRPRAISFVKGALRYRRVSPGPGRI